MHRVYDFVEEVAHLSASELAQLEAVAAAHRESGRVHSGVIVAVGADTFTLENDDGTQTQWPLRGFPSDYRRGLRCSVVVARDEDVGIGEAGHLRYVSLPELAEVWVASRGVVRSG